MQATGSSIVTHNGPILPIFIDPRAARYAGPACLPLHVLAQRPIDACLIAFIGCRVALEPGDDIGVEAKCQLLLDGPIEEAALGVGPIEEFRRVRRIDGAIGRAASDFSSASCSRVNRLEVPSHRLSFRGGGLPGADDAADRLACFGFGFRPSVNHQQQHRPNKSMVCQRSPSGCRSALMHGAGRQTPAPRCQTTSRA